MKSLSLLSAGKKVISLELKFFKVKCSDSYLILVIKIVGIL